MAISRVKTQVYLTPRQHRDLSREARRQGVSLAQLFRQLADGYLDRVPRRRPTAAAIRGITKLGASGVATTSRDHHRALDEALRRA
jgi:hypothetical protein